MKWAIAAALLSCATASLAMAGAQGTAYAEAGRCGLYPRADVTTPKGICVGVVAGPKHGLKMPRTVLEWAPGKFLVADMGGWVGTRGRILQLGVDASGNTAVATLYDRLRQPHGLALGPDRQVYVGQRGRISRFDPVSSGVTMETVFDAVPAESQHPLTHMIFDPQGALIVNVGAATDRCESPRDKSRPQDPCPELLGDHPRASLWKLTFDKPGGRVVKTEVLARGLRNSMGLAFDPQSGALIQAENGVDLSDDDAPAEELNVIEAGAHYGWPWCHGRGSPLPGSGWTAARCKQFTPARVLLPAHSAPLGMIVYSGSLFPELRGKLIVGFHGYREQGHRIVALDLDALSAGGKAKPALTPVVAGWTRKRGVRPQGAPVGLIQTSDGAIWFAEDNNRTIMALLPTTGAAARAPSPAAPQQAAAPAPKGWDQFASTVLRPKCGSCHAQLKARKADDIWQSLTDMGWAGERPLADSKLVRAMRGAGPEKPMPPPSGSMGDPAARAALETLLKANP